MQTCDTQKPWIAMPWDEMAGYDCITPGIHIETDKPDGNRIVTVDAANFGWNRTGLGNHAPVNHEQTRARVVAVANLIAAGPDMFSALLECEALLLAHDYPVILRQVKAAIAKAEGKA